MRFYWLYFGFLSLQRNLTRSLISILSIAGSIFLCIFADGLQTGSYRQMIENGVKSTSGHIGVYHKNYPDSKEVSDCFNPENLQEQISKYLQVDHVFSRLHAGTLARSPRGSEPAFLTGMDFVSEKNTHPLLQKKFLVEGQFPQVKNPGDALLGIGLCQKLGLKLNQKFVLMSQDIHSKSASMLFKVKGILKTGSSDLDGSLIFTTIENAQKFLDCPGQIHELSVLLKNPDTQKDVYEKILSLKKDSRAEVFYWYEAMPELLGIIRIDRLNAVMMALFLFLIVAIGIVNSLLMSVMERKREFGVLRAVGVSKREILMMVLSESAAVGIFACILGSICGLLTNWYFSVHGIDFSAMIDEIQINGTLVDLVVYPAFHGIGILVINISLFLITILASLYPARVATKVSPAEAMR